MQTKQKSYSVFLKDKYFLLSICTSLLLFALALFVDVHSGIYATAHASNSVTDLILSNVRTFDVDNFFVYGPLVFWVFIIILCVFDLHKMPFTFKSISLFLIIRAAFVSLTHIAPFPVETVITAHNFFSKFASGDDLFFSAHTGLPFLMALIFWDTPWIRLVCIASSIFFGIVVLLGHYHYSIDVFSAFFITYTIYHIATILFKRDLRLFKSGIETKT